MSNHQDHEHDLHEHDHAHEHVHDHEHHHHDHEHDACCAHDHHHDHDHEHHHHHDHDHCGCGHDHDHEEAVELDASQLTAHAIKCDRCGHPIDACTCPDTAVTSKMYAINGLDCADCAAKVEDGLKKIEGLEDVSVAYPAGLVKVTAKDPDRYLSTMSTVADKLEPGCEVVKRSQSVAESRKKEEEETGISAWFFGETYTKIQIILGAILFVAGLICEHTGVANPVWIGLYIGSYAIIGLPIVAVAIKMLLNGQLFDEHFLMAIATIGAFAIQEWSEAVGVMLFYRIGEAFEDAASERSRDQIMEAADLRPEVVNRIDGDDVTTIPSEEAQVGDIVLVRPGDRVPLDGVITEGTSRIDTSPVTGEPVPVAANVGDHIVSGCVNTSGTLHMRVEKPLSESMVTKILDSVENAAATKPKMDKFITRFSKYYTPIVVFAAIAVALIPPLVAGALWTKWIYTAMSFLVISCPCALVLSVPLAYFSGIGAGSKLGILFKGGLALEMLDKVKAVVMDKTGTITKGNFVVQDIKTAGGVSADDLLALGASVEATSTHPIASSIVKAAEERGLATAHVDSIEESAGHGIIAKVDGTEVLCGNDKLLADHGITIPENATVTYGTPVYLAKDGAFSGAIVIADTIKSDAKSAIGSLKSHSIKTVMLTGDTADNANAVAAETGIDEVHAKLLPEDKLSTLRTIREKDGSVMFVGDGINDAPVLAGADVGAAMGSGADAAIEAADVVFMNSDLEAVPTAIDIAKETNRIAWANVVFALAVKIIVMVMGLMGHANMWVAVFADTGVSVLCILNSIRILYKKRLTHKEKTPAAEAEAKQPEASF